MSMKKIKVSEATNIQIDWLVAHCEDMVESGAYGDPVVLDGELHLHYCDVVLDSPYAPSFDWSQGGPIIEREKISTLYHPDINCMTREISPRWIGSVVSISNSGPTPLVAAMRCFVASRLGDTVEVPEELT